MSTIDFFRIRALERGQPDAFEEISSQIFRRAPEAPIDGSFRRFRGAGGDRGIEACWRDVNGQTVWGVQAKFFQDFKNTQMRQMKESFHRAIHCHPHLNRYTFTFPKILTPTEVERVENWISKIVKQAQQEGRSIEVEFWDASELAQRLQTADPSGGIQRFWFDQTVLTDAWFYQHLENVTSAVGPRYTPKLTIDVPVTAAFEAFGQTAEWQDRIWKQAEQLSRALNAWDQSVAGEASSRQIDDVSGKFQSHIFLVTKYVRDAVEYLTVLSADSSEEKHTLVLERIGTARRYAEECEVASRRELEEKHGTHADSPGFRQWMAEFQATFPAAKLDAARELRTALDATIKLLDGPDGRLPVANTMLLHGPAGIGKTHAIVDHAWHRYRSGRCSVVFLGNDFSSEEPTGSMVRRVGLGGDVGRDTFLAMLNAAAEVSGWQIIVFIDALNETEPNRRLWRRWLPELTTEIARYSHLKLCVSCRDTYLRDICGQWEDIPHVLHNGFAGREFEAIRKFFAYYQLESPSAPLLQPEFSNPLFLHLLCQGLQKRGMITLPGGQYGLSAIIQWFLEAKNEAIAEQLDYDPRLESRVQEAVHALAAEMGRRQSRVIPAQAARTCVDGEQSHLPRSQSLFDQLERESLVLLRPDRANRTAGQHYYVYFTFERIADFLVAEHYISASSGNFETLLDFNGTLHFCVSSIEAMAEYQGLLEAIACLLPEHTNNEFIERFLEDERLEKAYEIFANSLAWRAPESVTSATRDAISIGFQLNMAPRQLFDALLILAPRLGHPINADYLDRLLRGPGMIDRDGFLAWTLHCSYEEKRQVWRLIDWALRSDLSEFSADGARLWCTALAWFCAAPDRRIRDQATKGIVRIITRFPMNGGDLIRKFYGCDDDYIVERIFVSVYGALLLARNRQALAYAGAITSECVFAGNVPANAVVRDHARLILEYCLDEGVAPENANWEAIRPPYESPWPITVPSQAEVAKVLEDRERFPGNIDLVSGMPFGTDFARYVIEPRLLRSYDVENAGLDRDGILRWFVKMLSDWGYPGRTDGCARFDRFMLGLYGGGRGRPGWAERLGKKYYWILLHRLAGLFADNLPRKKCEEVEQTTERSLQALELRDIDPTDIRPWELY